VIYRVVKRMKPDGNQTVDSLTTLTNYRNCFV